MAEDTRKRLLRYLNDAHAMEAGGLVSLQDIADRVTYPDARHVATDLCSVAKTQIARLAQRIEALGGTVSGNKTLFNSALAKGNRLTNAFHDQADKETQDIMKAYALSHLEVAAYTSLREYAQAIGDTDTAWLAQSLIEEEERAANRLYVLIPDLAVIPASPRYQSKPAHSPSSGGSGLGALGLPALLIGGAALTYYGAEYLRHRNSGSNNGNTGSNTFARVSPNAYPASTPASSSYLNTPATTSATTKPYGNASPADTAVIEVDVIEVVDVADAADTGGSSTASLSKGASSSGASSSSGRSSGYKNS